MSTELVAATQTRQMSILDMSAKDKITAATEMANILSEVIKKQGFSQKIQGREYVKVEGWITLGTLLGVIPKEKKVDELPDGSYIAEVELVRADSGRVIGGASALCSVDEKRWGSADKYARRSMAVTRATGKSYRIAFGWVVGLAGFETCNAEEMPDTSEPTDDIFTGSEDQSQKLSAYLKKQKVPDEKIPEIVTKMKGRSRNDVHELIKESMI